MEMKKIVLLLVTVMAMTAALSACSVPGKPKAETVTTDLFEITMPEELSGIYEAETEEGMISIYHKASREAGFPGLAFIIWAREVPSEYAGGPYKKVGELVSDGRYYDVVKGEATEVQWDYNEEEPEDFTKLYNAADSIIENMRATNDGTFMYGAGTKGEELYGYTLSQFKDALESGADAVTLEKSGYSGEFYAMLESGATLEDIGYAFHDVNVDGIDELFIGRRSDGAVFDIFTMIDRHPTQVVGGSARDRYYVYNDSFIANEYSGGADENGWNVYNLECNSTEMVLQWAYKYDGYENAENPWFKSWGDEVWEPVTEDEFNEAREKDSVYTDLGLLPLSEFKF